MEFEIMVLIGYYDYLWFFDNHQHHSSVNVTVQLFEQSIIIVVFTIVFWIMLIEFYINYGFLEAFVDQLKNIF